MKRIKNILTIFILLIIYVYITNITLIPDKIILLQGEKYQIKKCYGIKTIETVSVSNSKEKGINVELSLFGKVFLKNVQVDILEKTEVVPIGKIIGLRLYTNGVLIVGMSEIEDVNNKLLKPYETSNIKEGDTIVKINEEEIENIESLKKVVNKSEGKNVSVTVVRDGVVVTSNITPIKTKNNEYKLGLWVKDAATGVGTITYYEKETGNFAALGHGIVDFDTDKLIDIDKGEVVTSKILSIKKGENGKPGEIKGTILNQMVIGNITKNTQFGIYGHLTNLTRLNIDTSKSLEVALRHEIQVGEAKLLCALDDNITKEYKIMIEKIYEQNNFDNKSMLIKIIDDELLEKTGGIIRGLSGAPIIQNGKFIGAVTNVLVSNPEIGYAIFADMMIKEMNE